jgi:hypothetical protein
MLTTSTLAVGTHAVTASFAGDGTIAPSTSNRVDVTVAATTPTPTPTAAGPSPSPIPVVGPAIATDGPLVMSFQRFGYHSQPTVLVLSFNEPLDPATASNSANYTIVPISPHGKSGHPIAVIRSIGPDRDAPPVATIERPRPVRAGRRRDLGAPARRSRAPGAGRRQDRQGGQRLCRADRLEGDRRTIPARRALRQGLAEAGGERRRRPMSPRGRPASRSLGREAHPAGCGPYRDPDTREAGRRDRAMRTAS